MNPCHQGRLPAEANPLWRWERPWFFTPRLAGIAPLVFILAVALGFPPSGPPSPQATMCGNCAFADFLSMAVGLPLGTIASTLIGGAIGGMLDCIANQRDR